VLPDPRQPLRRPRAGCRLRPIPVPASAAAGVVGRAGWGPRQHGWLRPSRGARRLSWNVNPELTPGATLLRRSAAPPARAPVAAPMLGSSPAPRCPRRQRPVHRRRRGAAKSTLHSSPPPRCAAERRGGIAPGASPGSPAHPASSAPRQGRSGARSRGRSPGSLRPAGCAPRGALVELRGRNPGLTPGATILRRSAARRGANARPIASGAARPGANGWSIASGAARRGAAQGHSPGRKPGVPRTLGRERAPAGAQPRSRARAFAALASPG